MPYDSDNPPEKIKKLSPRKQRQWCHIFNSCWEKYKDEGKCHAMAWGGVKNTASINIAKKLLKIAKEVIRE